jgi:hypothetical protein
MIWNYINELPNWTLQLHFWVCTELWTHSWALINLISKDRGNHQICCLTKWVCGMSTNNPWRRMQGILMQACTTTTGPGSQVPKLQSLASPNPGTIYLHKETIPFCKILEPLSCSTKCWETECKHKPALIDKAHLGACRIEDNELPFVIQIPVNHPNIYL